MLAANQFKQTWEPWLRNDTSSFGMPLSSNNHQADYRSSSCEGSGVYVTRFGVRNVGASVLIRLNTNGEYMASIFLSLETLTCFLLFPVLSLQLIFLILLFSHVLPCPLSCFFFPWATALTYPISYSYCCISISTITCLCCCATVLCQCQAGLFEPVPVASELSSWRL